MREIFSLAAAQARVGAGLHVGPDWFLRKLSLLSRTWRQFGQVELVREIYVCGHESTSKLDDVPLDECGGVLASSLPKLIATLSARPDLASSVERFVMDACYADNSELCCEVIKLCTSIKRFTCYDSVLYLDDFKALSCKHSSSEDSDRSMF